MKFDHAWTLAGKPRGETPAPSPGKRPPVLPRPPACRALFRQGKRIFRTGRRQHLAFGEHAPGPGVPRLAAPPKRHNRRPSYPPPSHKARLGNIRIGQRLPHGAWRLACGGRIGPPRPNRLGSACWGASKIGSDFSNGGLRPDPPVRGYFRRRPLRALKCRRADQIEFLKPLRPHRADCRLGSPDAGSLPWRHTGFGCMRPRARAMNGAIVLCGTVARPLHNAAGAFALTDNYFCVGAYCG